MSMGSRGGLKRMLLVGIVAVMLIFLASELRSQTATPPLAVTNHDLSPTPFHHNFITRPDLHPPKITVDGIGTPGYVFFTPTEFFDNRHISSSLVIADEKGEIVYVEHAAVQDELFANFQKQSIGGRDVLTYWSGDMVPTSGYGNGVHRIVDHSYTEIVNFTMTDNLVTDLHDFVVKNHTIIATNLQKLPWDLSPFDGPQDGYLMSGVIQRLDIETKEILFEWKTIEHSNISDVTLPISDNPEHGTVKRPWDYFHINSIDLHPTEDSMLLSARHYSSVYNINGTTGEVIWILGGKHSDFAMGPGADFSLQHDARWVSPSEISVFDNAFPGGPSRGMILALNLEEMSCTLKQEFLHPDNIFSAQAGGMEVIPNANVFISYGFSPVAAEYAANGTLVSQMRWKFPNSEANRNFSYRMRKANWTAHPKTTPDIAVVNETVYISWNGATEVSYWDILAGQTSLDLHFVGRVPKTGFESSFELGAVTNLRLSSSYLVQTMAVDRQNRTLGSSSIIDQKGNRH